jgi:hypothetical protein
MSDRETKLAQSYEHYYWNSVEFLNRLKSTKVLPELIEEIEAKMEAFERNSADYEKLFDPRHPSLTEMPTLFIGAPARRYTEDKANEDWQKVETELIMSFPEGYLVGSAAECKKILRKIVVFKWRNDTRFRIIFHGNKVECNYGEHAWCFADGSELTWTDLLKVLKRRRNPFTADIVSDCPRASMWVSDTVQFNRDKHNQMIIHHINLYCPGVDDQVINYIQADAGDEGEHIGSDKLAFSVNKFSFPKKADACYHHHPAEFPPPADPVQAADDICEEAEFGSVVGEEEEQEEEEQEPEEEEQEEEEQVAEPAGEEAAAEEVEAEPEPEPEAEAEAVAEVEAEAEAEAPEEEPTAPEGCGAEAAAEVEEAEAAAEAAAEVDEAEAAVVAAEAASAAEAAKVIVVTPKGIWKFYPQAK